jgi:ABC-type sugar transport system substrate-binding protein
MKMHASNPTAKARTIELFLDSESNPYTRQIQVEAETEAVQHGLRVDTYFADNRFLQIQQLYGGIHAEPAQRPAAIAVLPSRDGSLARVARAALARGIDWICLHRRTGDLDQMRVEFPKNAVTLVGPDQREVGRVQGALARTMAPGGSILYVEGGGGNASAGERLTGFREIADAHCDIVGIIDGNWTAEDAEGAVSRWLNVMTPSVPQLDAVVCQSDAMAVGATVALRGAAGRLRRPDLAAVRVIGCDGMVGEGRQLVDEGVLAATVVIQGVGTHAVRVLADRLKGRRPSSELILPPRPYPGAVSAANVSRTVAPSLERELSLTA